MEQYPGHQHHQQQQQQQQQQQHQQQQQQQQQQHGRILSEKYHCSVVLQHRGRLDGSKSRC